ncbi:transducin/WD40 repeat-like superfamily protein [Actinidia rufa]|uniref:Transducin/WD40 repeat-like superfamily protein n=1 Tax=Actinidia rufa TaxID=165716 RepID=A0A7J0DRM4_9ERIC|nr:transducin/WD40 repeat-like superfamily protein [Actinidia rufa]
MNAIKHALKALRKRHLLEEGAHAPALIALSRPLASQSFKNFSSREKEATILDLQNELTKARDECAHLTVVLEEKTQALELVISENQELKTQFDEMTVRAKNAEAENKTLIDRWMLQKMQDAERLNEVNALYEDMLDQLKARGIEQLAKQQVDGVVRRSDEGSEYFAESIIPNASNHKIPAHEGGCAAIIFENNSGRLVSGGHDRTVKMWDTNTGSVCHTLQGCPGSVLDLTITHDNKSIIAASSSNSLYVWDVSSGQMRHTLTGHTDKVCAVDASKVSRSHLVSAAYDRTIKVWDLQKGHVDGNLRLWNIQTGKLLSEVAAHSLAVTSISLSRNGNVILTSGRDNLHNLFDVRSLEVCGTLRASGNRVASNWSRSCISPDDNYVASGSADGSVYIWSISKGNIVSTLKEHTASVLCCSWGGLGNPLASSDKNGIICTWT